METVRGAARRLSKISNCAFECNHHYHIVIIINSKALSSPHGPGQKESVCSCRFESLDWPGCSLIVSWMFSVPVTRQVYLRDGSAQTKAHAATLRWKLRLVSNQCLTPSQPVRFPEGEKLRATLVASISYSILTPGLPVLTLSKRVSQPREDQY